MRSVQALADSRPARPSLRLFKPDRRRAIDRYIDYFGGGGHLDLCGEALLDCLSADAEADSTIPTACLPAR